MDKEQQNIETKSQDNQLIKSKKEWQFSQYTIKIPPLNLYNINIFVYLIHEYPTFI